MPGVRSHQFAAPGKAMKHLKLLLGITLIWYSVGSNDFAQRHKQSFTKREFKVGMLTRSFVDAKRKNWQGTAPRPLRTAVWYPAVETATKEETIFGGSPEKEIFTPVTVAPDAEISGRLVRIRLSYSLTEREALRCK